MGKNIVLCFDGTGDWATFDKTNVMKIYSALVQDEDQVVFYNGGVGTLGSQMAISAIKRTYLKLLDLATATSLRDQVLDGYNFLVDKYEHGDDIYIFGFSRGAYTARLLASVVYNFGLLTPDNKHLGGYLWQSISGFRNFSDFLKDRRTIKTNFSQMFAPDAANTQKGDHRFDVPITFLGLFDTVSSVGIFDRFKVFPYTDMNPSVKIVRHAVSIQESRNAFPELLIRPAKMDLYGEDGGVNDVSEIWFPGVHRDIGGGAPDHPGYENRTLNWMVDEAKKAPANKAKFEKYEPAASQPPNLSFHHRATDDAKLHGSTFDIYVFVGLYPMKMFDYRLNDRKTMNWSFLRLLKMLRGQDIADVGYRWYWPNYKHYREIPSNGYEFTGTNGMVLDHENGNEVPFEKARNVNQPTPVEPDGNFLLRNLKCFPDFVGITLGCTLAFLIANRGMGEPFGTSWPRHSSTIVFWYFVFYLFEQGFSSNFRFNKKLAWIDYIVPTLGIVGLAWLYISVQPWTTLILGLRLGLAMALLSLVLPSKLPIMKADRVVPLFMVPWVSIMVALWGLPKILNPFLAGVGSTIEWLSGSTIRALTSAGSTSISWTGGPLWFMQGHKYHFLLNPDFTLWAWVFSLGATLSGMLQIVQDRRKMM